MPVEPYAVRDQAGEQRADRQQGIDRHLNQRGRIALGPEQAESGAGGVGRAPTPLGPGGRGVVGRPDAAG